AAPTVVTEHDAATGALLARNRYADAAGRLAFLAASEPLLGYTADRTEFLGRNGSVARPAALERAGLSGTVGAGWDPCGALQVVLELAPGEERELVLLLGEGHDEGHVRALVGAHNTVASAHQTLDAISDHWDHLLS